jgi:plasmid stabilization system protein ParE
LKNVIILARAGDDLEQLRLFYEGQQPGIGEHCVDSVLVGVSKLAQTSGIHSRRQQYHRMIDTTFHLGIYYREEGDDVLVVAIIDLRRDPKWLQNQLRQRPVA